MSGPTENDAGNYTCEANNTAFSKQSNVEELHTSRYETTKPDKPKPGKWVTIEVENVEANPKEVSYNWSIDGLDQYETSAKFTFIASEEGTVHEITVNVTNLIGSTADTMQITVSGRFEDWEIALIIIGAILGFIIVCSVVACVTIKCWNNKHIGKIVEGEDQDDGSNQHGSENISLASPTGSGNKTGKSSSFKVKLAKAEISTDSCLQIDYTLATGEIVEHFDWHKCDKKGGNKKFIVRSGDANSRFTVADDGSLKIPKVKEDDDGHYCCEMKTSLKVLSFHVKFTVTNASKNAKSSSKKNKSNVEPAIEMEEGNTQRYKAKGGDLYTEVNLKDKKKKQVEPEKDPSELDMDKTKKSDRPAQVDKRLRNVEELQYADLDLTRGLPKGASNEINHPDPETTYASIQQQPTRI
ncbi:uncharacterized protein [Antedon mediterranea]|uniref:uncharacterized protein n=1 Tax=Antedon mediterranea TaxID=105859 RepID=UPI003AF9946A